MRSNTSPEPASNFFADLEVLDAPAPWHAYLLPLRELPLPKADRAALRTGVNELVASLRGTSATERSVFLLFDDLHRDGSIREIARHGTTWRPEIGLGVLPEAEPPRLWTEKDLTDRDHGSPMPALMHMVAHLHADERGAESACEVMTGSSGLIQVLHAAPASDVLDRWFGVLQPGIEEEGLRAYPLYVPLLSRVSFAGRTAAALDSWMGLADVYLRESLPDKGLLIVSRFPLDPFLRRPGTVAAR